MDPVATTPSSPVSSIAALWAAYWLDRSSEARNALLVHYLPIVKFAAARLYNRRGRQTDIDDLIQYGTFGLKDAIGSFDPARGVKFETYCSTRVRGAMLDGLKAQQWLPRELRQKLTRFAEAQQQLIAEKGEAPEDDLIASRLGVCPDAIRGFERDAARSNVMSLFATAATNADGRETHHGDLLTDHRELEPADFMQQADVKELLMRELTRTERLILTMYYYEELTMRDIGAALGISGTRVSQMHSEIIQRLRERLERRVIQRAGRLHVSIDI